MNKRDYDNYVTSSQEAMNVLLPRKYIFSYYYWYEVSDIEEILQIGHKYHYTEPIMIYYPVLRPSQASLIFLIVSVKLL